MFGAAQVQHAMAGFRRRRFFVNHGDLSRAMQDKASARLALRTRAGFDFIIRQNLWDARIVDEIFIAQPYLTGVKLPQNPVVIDIGGYIGDFSFYCAAYLNAATVIVYEPTQENFELLKLNTSPFGERVIAVNEAVGTSESITVNVQKLGNDEIHVSEYWYDGCERRTVPCVNLVTLYSRHRLSKVDLLKIDCEGGEYGILQGAPNSVFSMTRNIVFEWHPIPDSQAMLAALREKLERLGYTWRLKGHIAYATR